MSNGVLIDTNTIDGAIYRIIMWQKELDSIMMREVPPVEGVGLALGIEVAEALYYYPVKWWKPDIVYTEEEYRIRFGMFLEEVIDAIHFAATYSYRKNITPKYTSLPRVDLPYIQPGAYSKRFAVEGMVNVLFYLQRLFWTEFPQLSVTLDFLFSYAANLATTYHDIIRLSRKMPGHPLLVEYGRKAVINVFRTRYPESTNALNTVKVREFIDPTMGILEIAEEVYNAIQKKTIRV